MILRRKFSVPKFQKKQTCLMQRSKEFGHGVVVGCPCSQKETHCRKEICLTCLFKTSISAVPVWNSKHPLLVRSLRLPRAAGHSTGYALCLHYAHPAVAAAEKHLSHAEKQRICYNAVLVLSVVLCDCCKPTNTYRD